MPTDDTEPTATEVSQPDQYCPNCGTGLTGDAAFCSECGAELDASGSDKSPTVSAVLSFFLIGAGQVYCGRLKRGVGLFVLSFVLGVLGLISDGLTTLLVFPLWIYNIYDAYTLATSSRTTGSPRSRTVSTTTTGTPTDSTSSVTRQSNTTTTDPTPTESTATEAPQGGDVKTFEDELPAADRIMEHVPEEADQALAETVAALEPGDEIVVDDEYRGTVGSGQWVEELYVVHFDTGERVGRSLQIALNGPGLKTEDGTRQSVFLFDFESGKSIAIGSVDVVGNTAQDSTDSASP